MSALLGKVFSGLGKMVGVGDSLEKVVEVAGKSVIGKDATNQLISELIMKKMETDSFQTIPMVDAFHKMGRQLMSFALIYVYYESWKAGNPIPVESMAMLAGLPALYTWRKGKGA